MWRDKHRRAWEPFRPYEVTTITILPVVAAAIVLWLGTRDEADAMTTVVYPTIAFAVVAFVLVVGFHFGPYAYRLLTGGTAAGRGRTLVGLNLGSVKQALVKHNPSIHNSADFSATIDSVEVRNFTDELKNLLAECEWDVDRGFGLISSDERITDLEIHPQGDGHVGLTVLAALLRKVGYRVSLIPSKAPAATGSPTAWIYVGEATH
jgi:hypothetical protein